MAQCDDDLTMGKARQVLKAAPKQQRRLPRSKVFRRHFTIATTITTGYGVMGLRPVDP